MIIWKCYKEVLFNQPVVIFLVASFIFWCKDHQRQYTIYCKSWHFLPGSNRENYKKLRKRKIMLFLYVYFRSYVNCTSTFYTVPKYLARFSRDTYPEGGGGRGKVLPILANMGRHLLQRVLSQWFHKLKNMKGKGNQSVLTPTTTGTEQIILVFLVSNTFPIILSLVSFQGFLKGMLCSKEGTWKRYFFH